MSLICPGCMENATSNIGVRSDRRRSEMNPPFFPSGAMDRSFARSLKLAEFRVDFTF
jgi:hypothetical protein